MSAIYQQSADTTFNDVNDTLVLQVNYKDPYLRVTFTDADQQTIQLQEELGSPNSGAWRTIKEWASGSAAVTWEKKVRAVAGTRFRLFLAVDGGGTNSVTLNELNEDVALVKAGPIQYNLDKFDVDAGQKERNEPAFITETASFTVDPEKHLGKIIKLSAAAGLTVTLPSSTGSGNKYKFLVVTTVTTNDYIVSCDADAGAFVGSVTVATDASGVEFLSDGVNDLITMNGSTTGGLLGSVIEITDVATDFWFVEGFTRATGAEATPFSGT
jgi:hypothetical protein